MRHNLRKRSEANARRSKLPPEGTVKLEELGKLHGVHKGTISRDYAILRAQKIDEMMDAIVGLA